MCGKLTLSIFILTTAAAVAQTPVSFSKDIQPIFEASCWKCHGAAVQLSKLDLRTRQAALTGGVHGSAILPGNAQTSRLFRMVAGIEKPAMPLDGKLKPEQIEAIRLWIEQGANWDVQRSELSNCHRSRPGKRGRCPNEARKYWAFQKPVRRTPSISGRHPVDAFLLKVMQDEG